MFATLHGYTLYNKHHKIINNYNNVFLTITSAILQFKMAVYACIVGDTPIF